jgi:hypothetical protein
MIPEAREWLAGLRQHVDESRRVAGPAGHTGLASAAQEAAERMILSAHLVTWLENELQGLIAERDAGPEPVLVITTSPAGLRVAEDVLGRADPLMESLRHRAVAVTEQEYRSWTKNHPDPDYQLHINHWSWIKTQVPDARRDEFRGFPIGAGEHYWLHRTGTIGCGRERRYCHLWKWNGSTAALLKPFVAETVRRL